MSNLSHNATLDTTDYISGINRMKKETSSFTKTAVDNFDDLDAKLRAIGAGIATYFSVAALKNFTSQIIRVRGEFQQLEIGLETMLGNKAKADALMRQVIEFAAKTPFDMQQVATGTKQLIAYGVAAEDVIPTMRRLGDIASGLGLAFGDMAYLYGTTRVQGRLYAQDLRQFTGRGIPLIEQLAKQFNVATGEVSKLVSEGKVGFPEVEKAIQAMTDEGGRFFNLTEKNSKTLSGMISNLGDSFQQMYNDIGKQTQGVLVTGIEGVATLVEHWREIAKVLAVIITAYGTYKAAVLAVAAAQKIMIAANTAKTFLSIAKSVRTAKDAMLLFNLACQANPLILLASVVTTAIVAFNMFSSSVDEAEEEIQGLTKANQAATEEFAKQASAIDALKSSIESTTTSLETKKKAIEQLKKVIPGYNAELDAEGRLISSNTEKIKEYLVQLERQIRLKAAQEELEDLYRKKRLQEKEVADRETEKLSADQDLKSLRSEVDRQLINDPNAARSMQAQGQALISAESALNRANSALEEAQTNLTRTTNDIAQLVDEIESGISASDDTNKTAKTFAEQLKLAREAVVKLKKELADLQSGKMPSDNYAQAIADKAKELKEAEGKLNILLYGSSTGNAGSAAISKRRNSVEDELEWREEMVSQARRTQNAIRQATIDEMKEGFEKEQAEKQFEHEKELQAIDARAEEMKRATYEYNKKIWEAAHETGVYEESEEGKGGWMSVELTEDQLKEIDALTRSANAKWADYQEDLARRQLENLYDFLEAYGTVEEQRYAITRKYDDLIERSQDALAKKRLQREKMSALARVNANSIAASIDWGQTFRGIGSVLEGIAKETLDKVKEYMKTDEFQKLSPDSKKAYSDLRKTLVQAGGAKPSSPFNPQTWDNIGKYAEVYKTSVENLLSAQDRHKKAVDDLIAAEENLKNATDTLAETTARENVENAKKIEAETAEKLKQAEFNKVNAQADLTEASEQAARGLQNFTTVLNQVTSGSLSGFITGIANIVNQISGKGKEVANSLSELGGKIGGIIGAILQLIDVLGEEPAEFIDGLLGKVEKVVEAVLTQLPDIIMSVIEGILDIVAGAIRGVANLFSNDQAFGSNKKESEDRILALTEATDALKEAIEHLTDTIKDSDSTNEEAIDAYNQAIAAEKQWEELQRGKIQSRAGEWTNSGYGFLGMAGKHSFNYYAGDLSSSVYAAFTKALKEHGYDTIVSGVGDVWNLSPEEMKVLRDFAPSAWAEFLSAGGESSPKDLLNSYIERAGTLDALTSALNEKLTGYSWDAFKDSYVSLLKDLTSDTEDFANNIEDLISNALITAFINSDDIQGRVKALYKKIADYTGVDSEGGTALTEAEINDLRATNEDLGKDLLAWRDAAVAAGLIKSTGAEYKQIASTGGFQAMSQDVGEELSGRFTAIQMHTAQIYASIVETVNLLIIQNDHLANIEKYTKVLSEINEKLENIKDNTDGL